MNMAGGKARILLGAALGLVGLLALAGGDAAAGSAVPYTDPDAVGSIGLCNQAGQQITSGSVTAKPFAWRAVSTEPAPAPYNNAGRTATLVAYQPQQALPPGDWSGAQMTSSSSYTNPANPMAAATANDQSLQDIIDQYPPVWDGFLQLRMYLSTADKQAFTLHYPTLDIQVTGTTWRAVGGSPVNCASGTAVSIESVLLPSSTTTTTSTTAAASTPSPAATPTTAASGQGKGAAVGATPASDAKSSPSRGTPAGSAQASGSGRAVATTQTSDFPVVLGSALAVLVVLAAAVVLVLRRRRLTTEPSASGSSLDSSSPISSPTSSSSTKGDTP